MTDRQTDRNGVKTYYCACYEVQHKTRRANDRNKYKKLQDEMQVELL